MSNSDSNDKTDSDALAQLLAKAGSRPTPPAAMEAEVRAAVHAEWVHLTQARKVRQQRRWLAAAAVVFGVFTMGWLTRNMSNNAAVQTVAPASVIATIHEVQGAPLLNDASVGRDAQIHAGDVLRTNNHGGMRIALNNGIDLRIAADSEVHWQNSSELRLVHGAAYVDSHTNVAALTIHTNHGDVTHLGTRYMISVDGQRLRVAVREGKVAIHSQHTDLTVNALEQLQLDADAQALRSDLQMNDAGWQWADALATPFMLENRSVAEFLQWAAEETGCEVNYANNSVKAAAEHAVLHGQQTSLAPLQALSVILATTDFRANVQGKQLLVTQSQ